MPGVPNNITNVTIRHRVDNHLLQESLHLYKSVKERLSQNNFDEALVLTYQISHPAFKSDAINALFPQFVVRKPQEVVALLAQIQDPLIKIDCQTFACFKLNQLGLKHLVRQVSDASDSLEVKRTAARLLQ